MSESVEGSGQSFSLSLPGIPARLIGSRSTAGLLACGYLTIIYLPASMLAVAWLKALEGNQRAGRSRMIGNPLTVAGAATA